MKKKEEEKLNFPPEKIRYNFESWIGVQFTLSDVWYDKSIMKEKWL